MKVVTPGHIYALTSLDGDLVQHLTFVQRVGDQYPGNEESHAGTTSQEVLRALHDRAIYVNRQQPCVETEMMIGILAAAITLCEMRAKRVKGQQLEYLSIGEVLAQPTCSQCGHVGCKDHEPVAG